MLVLTNASRWEVSLDRLGGGGEVPVDGSLPAVVVFSGYAAVEVVVAVDAPFDVVSSGLLVDGSSVDAQDGTEENGSGGEMHGECSSSGI